VIGQAVPSYGPQYAGSYVKKLDCFCFKQQTFAPHEVREMPVVFLLEKGLPEDVNTVTLSYTFFEVPAGSTNSSTGGKPEVSDAGVRFTAAERRTLSHHSHGCLGSCRGARAQTARARRTTLSPLQI
jgi:hypothetical protein